MKRDFSLLFFVLILNGCDDGDLTLETIDFEAATTQSCSDNNIIYKLKESEALLLETKALEYHTRAMATAAGIEEIEKQLLNLTI